MVEDSEPTFVTLILVATFAKNPGPSSAEGREPPIFPLFAIVGELLSTTASLLSSPFGPGVGGSGIFFFRSTVGEAVGRDALLSFESLGVGSGNNFSACDEIRSCNI